MMNLKELIQDIPTLQIVGTLEVTVDYISQDTRESFTNASLYFAVPGTVVDGYDFIEVAIKQGAKVIIAERLPDNTDPHVTYIIVAQVLPVIGFVASRFFDNPSSEMTVVGVTGTNGKTSIATILSQAYEFLGHSTLLLSTAGDYFHGQEIKLNRHAVSSLEVIELHRTLRTYRNMGATYCFLEVTSHGAFQHRQRGIDFDVAIFTNLTQDHLNYHGSMEAYAQAKKMFFDYLASDTVAIMNADDNYSKYMITDTQACVVWYGSIDKNSAKNFDKGDSILDYQFTIHERNDTNTLVSYNDELIRIPTVGDFNVYNYLACYATLCELEIPKDQAVLSLEQTKGALGRFTIIEHHGVRAIVDYAHSPDSLENVLKTARTITKRRLTTVIGLGGSRDVSKRPIMGNISAALSDFVYFTSDNPRDDDPEEILNDIVSDLQKGMRNSRNWTRILDRRVAIETALKEASRGDVIVIAGKGHEEYQEIRGVKYPFSDKKVVEEYWN